MGWLLLFPELVVIVAAAVYEVFGALVTETREPVGRWFSERWNPFWDSGQTPEVRRWALRLASHRHGARMEAARQLGEMGDASAVPALVKAVDRYRRDGRILEMVVDSLRRIGDERAIPALRSLASGRHYALMAAARDALAELEPRSSLLRAADSGDTRSLLRTAHEKPGDSGLLRPVGE